jgi:hypothetical protein
MQASTRALGGARQAFDLRQGCAQRTLTAMSVRKRRMAKEPEASKRCAITSPVPARKAAVAIFVTIGFSSRA